jgi:hypothetical protein
MSDTYYRSSPESSPDPLAASIDAGRPQGRRMTRTPKRPLASSSPSKQSSRKNMGELEIVSSPSKSIVLNTPRGRNASPWRIKVTVQAEPGSDEMEQQSPSVKHVMRTHTTTIPLKDADASSPVKRRGRPRKSETEAKPKTKRNGTPVKRTPRAKSRKRDTSVEVGAGADADTDAPPKRRRGRPRKSVQPPVPVEETPQRMTPPVIETTFATPHDQQDESAEDSALNERSLSSSKRRRTQEMLDKEHVKFTPSQTELSQRIRARKGTPVGKIWLEVSSDEESDEQAEIQTPPETDGEAQLRHDDFGPIYAPSDDDYESEGLLQDETDFALQEEATRMFEDTIHESENFTMISVDCLPNSGGLTSLVYEPIGTTPSRPQEAVQSHDYLKIPAADARQPNSLHSIARSSPGPIRAAQSAAPTRSSPQNAHPRYITPLMEEPSPSNPPLIAPARTSPTEAETPQIGRVVKAGVALQGLLEPSHETPEAGPSNIGSRRPSELDDLFRGFSDRTRKDLRANLRLGEQLAKESPRNKESPVAFPSPIKAKSPTKDDGDVFGPKTKNKQSHLLTPEENDGYALPTPPPPQPADVQYPSLREDQEGSHLLSPATSPVQDEDEDKMHWQVDTPPVNGITAAGGRFMTAINERGGALRGKDLSVVADRDASSAVYGEVTNEHGEAIRGRDIFVVADEAEHSAGYGDVWQEEGIRLSGVSEVEDDQDQDLFAPGPPKAARGKPPRTWRRKNFQHNNEAEESPKLTPSSIESKDSPQRPKADKGKNKATVEDLDSDDDSGSDDTGMFFTSNLPNVFRDKQPARERKAEKLDLSMLLNEGESLLPEPSPVVVVSKTPAKPNPFKDTPPRFAYLSSPARGSPLRNELRASASPESSQQAFEESTLPLPPSSPFHTQVDDSSTGSIGSDERQLREEMANRTDTSLRIIRNEADDYLDAYEAQERTLDEIEEVTEVSGTYTKQAISTPLGNKQDFEDSLVNRKHNSPLVSKNGSSSNPSSSKDRSSVSLASGHSSKSSYSEVPKSPPKSRRIAVAPRESTSETAQASSGLFGRLASTFSAFITTDPDLPPPPPTLQSLPTPPPPQALPPPPPQLVRNHPIVFTFDRLPKVQPWTKTHYKTLDHLFSLHTKHPMFFSTNPTSLNSQINNALLEDFICETQLPYIDAIFHSWGYSFRVKPAYVVICAVFFQLLSLNDVFEYESLAGKRIQVGDCNPGRAGERIEREEVMQRFATVVLGEMLRRDERRGVVVERVGGLEVTWPVYE